MNEEECWCEYVDIGVGMQRVTDNPECPEHNPGLEPVFTGVFRQANVAFADLRQVVLSVSRSMRRSTWTMLRTCGCPTATHRMSCGQGATPKVVVK